MDAGNSVLPWGATQALRRALQANEMAQEQNLQSIAPAGQCARALLTPFVCCVVVRWADVSLCGADQNKFNQRRRDGARAVVKVTYAVWNKNVKSLI